MRVSRRFFPLSVALLLTAASWAQHPGDAARSLGRRISLRLEAGEGVNLTVRNLSSLGPAEEAEVRRALEDALRRPGGGAQAPVLVTLSENVQGYLWVAEIRHGEDRQVVMLGVPKPQTAGPAAPAATFAIDKKLLWEQDEPILDLAVLEAESFLVLEPGRVWTEKQSVVIPSFRPWPRDPRGRLIVEGDSFRAYLPGTVCRGLVRPGLRMDCRADDEPWPLYAGNRLLAQAYFAIGRNFFDGQLLTASGVRKSLPPFYSAAGTQDIWILSGVDGQARIYDGSLEPTGVLGTTGSDLAGIETPCGSRAQVLVTKPGELEAVQAYDIRNRQAVPVGAPSEFSGPITALWPASGGGAAVAVTRDPKTGRYAAFRLGVSCGS